MKRIETERLVLRPREPMDAPGLHRILMDADVMERVFAEVPAGDRDIRRVYACSSLDA